LKLALIGTHGVGKTTLAYEICSLLKKADHNVELVTEVARRSPFPVNEATTLEGQLWILHAQIAAELDAASRAPHVVCDRSALDNYCYLVNKFGRQPQLENWLEWWMETYSVLIAVPPLSGNIPADGFRSENLEFQQRIHELLGELLVELPFPSNISVVDNLIFAYLDEIRPPAHTYFVLDISGSMEGDRLNGVKKTFDNLTGADQTITGRFSRLRAREEITIIPFNGSVVDDQTFTINDVSASSPDLAAVRHYVDNLQANDGTAIYDALIRAYNDAAAGKRSDPDRFYSVVLMTDGENNMGHDAGGFARFYNSQPADVKAIPTFAIIFGEASPQELTNITTLTGGQAFDSRNVSLASVFKVIRGYQ
jgi:uncharacterized protein YegL